MTAPIPQSAPPIPKSTFVTVIAWIFIVCSGLATLGTLLQNLMLAVMPRGIWAQATQDSTFARVMPPGARFMFTHLQVIVLILFVMCALTLFASVGLLRRQNWARITFIVLLSLGIVYNIGNFFVQRRFMASMSSLTSGFGGDSTFQRGALQMNQMIQTVKTMAMVFTVAFSGFYAWIIYVLNTPRIRGEFTEPR